MIILDTDMPKKCMDCQLLGRDEMYCTLYPRKELDVITVATSKPDWCPIKCDIEDIKAEFTSLYPKNVYGGLELDGRSCVFSLNKIFEVIDNHIGERSE